MTRQYFKTKEKMKRKSHSMTKLAKEKAKAEHERFINSDEGKAAIERLSLIDDLSAALAAKV